MRQELLLKRINTCCESEECDIPIDRHLVGCIARLEIQITLISWYVLWIAYAIDALVLALAVRATSKEPRECAFRMAEGQTMMRILSRTSAKARDIAKARSVLTKDMVEATLCIDEILLVACEAICIEALYTTPTTTLGITSPEEIFCAVAIRRAVHGGSLSLLQIWR